MATLPQDIFKLSVLASRILEAIRMLSVLPKCMDNLLSGTAEAGTETNDWVWFLTSFNRIGKRQPYKHKYKFIIAIIAKQPGVTLAM